MTKADEMRIKTAEAVNYIKKTIDSDIKPAINKMAALHESHVVKITKVEVKQKIQWGILIFIFTSILGLAFWILKNNI